jgi:hypothetical protein
MIADFDIIPLSYGHIMLDRHGITKPSSPRNVTSAIKGSPVMAL